MKDTSYRMLIIMGLVAILALGFTLTACKTTESAGEQIDDAWITGKVKTKLAADPEINPFNIDVDTLQGVVTLSGIVPTQASKRESEKLARQTQGVKKVENRIQVKPKEPPRTE